MSAIKRALLVIDVQNEYVTGNLRIEYPPIKQSLANIETIIKTAKQHHIPVVAIQHTAPSDAAIFAEGSDGWQLLPMVANLQPDEVITKKKANCFAQTMLQQYVEQQAITTLTIIGYMTHNCNMATAIAAQERGYEVEFITDASGSLPYANEAGKATAEEIHRTFSVVLQSSFAATLTTNEWLNVLKNNTVGKRSNILLSNQQAKL